MFGYYISIETLSKATVFVLYVTKPLTANTSAGPLGFCCDICLLDMLIKVICIYPNCIHTHRFNLCPTHLLPFGIF